MGTHFGVLTPRRETLRVFPGLSEGFWKDSAHSGNQLINQTRPDLPLFLVSLLSLLTVLHGITSPVNCVYSHPKLKPRTCCAEPSVMWHQSSFLALSPRIANLNLMPQIVWANCHLPKSHQVSVPPCKAAWSTKCCLPHYTFANSYGKRTPQSPLGWL